MYHLDLRALTLWFPLAGQGQAIEKELWICPGKKIGPFSVFCDNFFSSSTYIEKGSVRKYFVLLTAYPARINYLEMACLHKFRKNWYPCWFRDNKKLKFSFFFYIFLTFESTKINSHTHHIYIFQIQNFLINKTNQSELRKT